MLKQDTNKIRKAIAGFKQLRIGVIGDLMLDKYIIGKVDRISPEAPVPVVLQEKETFAAGGAGNVASNLASLGAKASLISAIGNDPEGGLLEGILAQNKIDISGILRTASRKTTLKTRIIARNQQVVRIDREQTAELSKREQDKMLNYLKKNAGKFDALVISDYDKGTLTGAFAREILKISAEGRLKVLLDTKKKNVQSFKGVYMITPNRKESFNISGQDDEAAAAKTIGRLLGCSVLITLGQDGMLLYEKRKLTRLPSLAREVFDVSGAGDTVIAVMALGIASGLGFPQSAYLANCAAGITVGKLGAASVYPEELLGFFYENSK